MNPINKTLHMRLCPRCLKYHKTYTKKNHAICEKCKHPIGKHTHTWSKSKICQERHRKLDLIKLKLGL